MNQSGDQNKNFPMIETIRAAALIVLHAILMMTPVLASDNGDLYESDADRFRVTVDDSVTLLVPDEDRELPLRIVYPDGEGPYPVIVLSHGTFSSGRRYDAVAGYWAARGYVVMLPDHVDANYGVIPKKNEDMFRVSRLRVADLTLIADSLTEIESRLPALAGRLDHSKLVVAGHSFGTQIAMFVTGMRMRNPTNGDITASDETRFGTLILLSDPGKMALMPSETWTGSGVPTLLSTGTEDYGLMGDGRRATEYENEILSRADNASVSRYLLMIERGDHYFGGLIHKDTGTEPDHEGLAIFNAISMAFLDAYVKEDQDAREFLQAVDLQAETHGRAALTSHGSAMQSND